MNLRSVALLSLAATTGCSLVVQPDLNRIRDGGGSTQDAQPTDTGVDPDVVVPPEDVVEPPDATPMCPASCDDGIGCTSDRCNDGVCIHTPDNTACGPEMRCDLTSGCVSMPTGCNNANDCNDNNPCTVDACNARMCANTPLDRDMDGSPAAMVDGRVCVASGGDCNDNDRAINPSATEVCGDRVDNNCNGMTDELPTCMPTATNTTCAMAQRIDLTSATMADVPGVVSGSGSTVQGYCGGRSDLGTGGELWYQIAAPSSRDVWIEAIRADGATWDPVLWVGEGCGRTPYACNDDIGSSNPSSRVIVRAENVGIGTRTIFVAVDAFTTTGGAFTLRVRVNGPAGRDCAGALTFDGGTVRAPTGIANLGGLSCGGGTGQVEPYHYRGATGQVRLFTSSGSLAVKRDCGSSMSACVSSGSSFMSGSGDAIITLERPSSPYVFTLLGP